MKRVKIIFLAFFLLGAFTLHAQVEYKTGIGIRAGWPTAVSIKHFFGKDWALEGFVTGRHRGVGGGLLYEKHKAALLERGLFWFYGAGLHGSFFNAQYYRGPHTELYEKDSFSFGVDGIIGLEYYISEIPFTVGIDLKPALEINYGPYFDFGSAITVRYAF